MRLIPTSAMTLACSFLLLGLPACGKKSTKPGVSANLPLVTPPVKAAAPKAFTSSTSLGLTTGTLSAADFKTRFFTTGPTNVFDILTAIDERINGINTQSKGISPPPACLSQGPVSYTITPWSQSVTMYGQCYTKVSGPGTSASDPAIVQWGVKDGVTYLYYAIGAERVGVVATPVSGSTTDYTIHAWIGLGYSNTGAWDSGSYGVMEIQANSSTKVFEFTVAGMGFGYCGAQMQSDGTSIYGAGSADQGSTCVPTDTLCVLASDATTLGTCGAALTTFKLTPIGRGAVAASSGNKITTTFAASAYPSSGGTVTLNGTSSDALYFGPLTPTAGVGQLSN